MSEKYLCSQCKEPDSPYLSSPPGSYRLCTKCSDEELKRIIRAGKYLVIENAVDRAFELNQLRLK